MNMQQDSRRKISLQQAQNQEKAFDLIPICDSLQRRIRWVKESKALRTSKNKAARIWSESIAEWMKLEKAVQACSVEWLTRNPNWRSCKNYFASRKLRGPDSIAFSKILLKTDRREIGIISRITPRTTFIQQYNLARMRDSGKISFSKDRLTSLVNGDRIAGRKTRITFIGILSGPEEDDPLRALTIRATLNSETEFKIVDFKHDGPW